MLLLRFRFYETTTSLLDDKRYGISPCSRLKIPNQALVINNIQLTFDRTFCHSFCNSALENRI